MLGRRGFLTGLLVAPSVAAASLKVAGEPLQVIPLAPKEPHNAEIADFDFSETNAEIGERLLITLPHGYSVITG